MKQNVMVKQLEENLEISNNSFLGKMGISYKGEKLNKVSKFNYSLVTETGETLNISLKRKLGGIDMPILTINSREIPYVRALSPLEKIILLLPVSFLFFGAIGGLFSSLTFMLTVDITRSLRNHFLAGVVNLAIIIGMFFLVMLVGNLVLEMLGF